MSKKDQNIPVTGMTNAHPMNIKDSEYPFMLNGNIQTDINGPIMLTNENSNILCLQTAFTNGYKFIGGLYVPENQITFVFLVNPLTQQSEIGLITEYQYIQPNDTPSSDPCDDCGSVNVEQPPLETLPQEATCEYTCIAANPCLNFNIDFPIRKIVYKKDNCGSTLYFTDFFNPIRAVKLTPDNTLDDSVRTIVSDVSCEEIIYAPTCSSTDIDCNKIRLFPQISHISVDAKGVVPGGSLRAGTYQLAVCYADENGQRATRTFSTSNPISIFDSKQTITSETSYITNLSAKFTINNLDSRAYKYIDVFVIATINNVSSTKQFKTVDISSIINGTLEYTLSDFEKGKDVTIDDVLQIFPVYDKAQEITVVGNSLLLGNLVSPRDFNLQPAIVKLSLTDGLKWQTIEAKENFYSNGVNPAKFRGFLRDEAYPVGLVLEINNTLDTCVYPFVGRPSAGDDKSTISNNDVFPQDSCSSDLQNERWQVYNTASPGTTICGYDPTTAECIQLKSSISCSSYSFTYDTINYTPADPNPLNGATGTITSSSGGSATIVESGVLGPNAFIYITAVTGTFLIGDTITVGADTATITQFTPGDNPEPLDCYVDTDDALSPCADNYPVLYTDPTVEASAPCDPNVAPVPNNICIADYVRPQTYITDPAAKHLCIDDALALYDNTLSVPYALLIETSITKTSPAAIINARCYDNTAVADILSHIPYYNNPSTNLSGSGPFFYPGEQDPPIAVNRTKDNAAFIISANDGQCLYYTSPDAAPTIYFFGNNYNNNVAIPNLICPPGAGPYDPVNYPVGDVFNIGSTSADLQQDTWLSFIALSNTQVISLKLFDRVTNNIPADAYRMQVYDGLTGSEITSGPISNSAGGGLVWIAGDLCNISPPKPLVIGRTYYIHVYLNTASTYVTGTGVTSINYEQAGPTDYNCDILKTQVFYNYAWMSVCVNVPEPSSTQTITVPSFYVRSCTYDVYYRVNQVPNNGCDYKNYEQGAFAYWESTKNYPTSTYIDTAGNTQPLWGEMCNQPIRHFKFPDCLISPMQDANPLGPSWGRMANIYPLGLNIDTEVIKKWLIWASTPIDVIDPGTGLLGGGLITDDERNQITGYKIVRGNRVGNKSIAAKGLLFDMWSYNLYDYTTGIPAIAKTYYPSYPFNDLRQDNFLTIGPPLNAKGAGTQSPNAFRHPFNGTKNNKFTFLSPDTTFNSPTIGTELKFEAVLYGDAIGTFYTVQNHPKYVILSIGGIILIQTLTILTWMIDLLNLIVDVWKYFNAGFTFTVGTAVAFAAAIAAWGLGSVGKYLQYGHQWQQLILGFGVPQNFAKYYAAIGNYHSEDDVQNTGNKRREIFNSLYLNAGNYSISEYGNTLNLNNYKREDSVYLSLATEIDYTGTALLDSTKSDNSRFRLSDVGGNTRDNLSRVASYYGSIKYYVPDQYGELSDIEWIHTGSTRKIDWNNSQDETCNPIFGGDTFISRMTQKRKYPFFLNNAVNVSSSEDFQYRLLGNITTPTYYFNSLGESAANSTGVNFTANETNLDQASYSGLYTSGTMYLFSYGITSFLCESDYNLNFRYATDNKDRAFYPYQSDIEGWTQEYRVPIEVPNSYQYNRDYSKQNKENFFCKQPTLYFNDTCVTTYKNRVINSQSDTDSDFFSDSWRIFLANDYHDFPLENGQLVGMDGIEREKLLLRFANTSWVMNAYYTMETSAGQAQIGSSSLFGQKPVEYAKTNIGYAGTQHHAFVTTQYGHFWVDAARSAVFMLPIGDGAPQEISTTLNTFFNNNLPFFILKSFPDYNVDNNYKQIGISMGWDNRFDRVFLTKLDYELRASYIGKVVYDGTTFVYTPVTGPPVEIFLTDSTYFCNKSWTVAYSPLTKSWISYYSFVPNFYIDHENYFQTGINYSQTLTSEELGIWNHLITNRSYQVFYGKLYPFITDVVIKEQLVNKQLQSIEYQADFLRFQNDYDYFYNPRLTFNKMVIWAENRNSGNLELVPQISGNLSQSLLYPRSNSNSTTVLVTNKENNWRVNQFWDLVRNKHSNVPPMTYGCHPYFKQVNPTAIEYNKPTFQKSRMTSDYFTMRFNNDQYSNYKIINKWFLNNTIQSIS